MYIQEKNILYTMYLHTYRSVMVGMQISIKGDILYISDWGTRISFPETLARSSLDYDVQVCFCK